MLIIHSVAFYQPGISRGKLRTTVGESRWEKSRKQIKEDIIMNFGNLFNPTPFIPANYS